MCPDSRPDAPHENKVNDEADNNTGNDENVFYSDDILVECEKPSHKGYVHREIGPHMHETSGEETNNPWNTVNNKITHCHPLLEGFRLNSFSICRH